MTSTALAPVVTKEAPSTALAPQMLRPIARPAQVLDVMKETRALLRETLDDGVDFGVIPGTDKDRSKAPKKTLLKPGAEKIAAAFGCRADYDVVESEADHDRVFRRPSEWVEAPQPSRDEQERMKREGSGRSRKVNGDWQWQVRGQGESVTYGLYRFVVRCSLVRFDGVVAGSGLGVCSTMESKYISRPSDCENTALKMAMKRALVAAVLGTFGLSEAFTQDVGDDEDDEDVRMSERTSPPPQPKPVNPAQQEMTALKAQIDECLAQLNQRADDEQINYVHAALHDIEPELIDTPLKKRRVLAAILVKDVEREKAAKMKQAALIPDDTDKRGGAL